MGLWGFFTKKKKPDKFRAAALPSRSTPFIAAPELDKPNKPTIVRYDEEDEEKSMRKRTDEPEVSVSAATGASSSSPMVGVDSNVSETLSLTTTTISEPTPSRRTVERSIEYASGGDVRAAVYYAYTDVLHRRARRGEEGGLRKIVALLRAYEYNEIVVENAATTIALLCENDLATRDVFGSYGAVEALLGILLTRTEETVPVENLLHAISNLVKNSPRNVRLLENYEGILPLMRLASSKRFESRPKAARYALCTVAALKHRHQVGEKRSQPRIVYKGQPGIGKAILYALRAMRIHEEEVEVQEAGLDAVRTLLEFVDYAQLQTPTLEKAITAAATAFEKHGTQSKDVIWQSLALQCDIDAFRDLQVEIEVNSFFSALKAVVQKEECTPPWVDAVAALVARAFVTASRVAWTSVENKEAAASAGAADVCIMALESLSVNRKVVERTCSVMRSLFDSASGRSKLDSIPTASTLLDSIEISLSRQRQRRRQGQGQYDEQT